MERQINRNPNILRVFYFIRQLNNSKWELSNWIMSSLIEWENSLFELESSFIYLIRELSIWMYV